MLCLRSIGMACIISELCYKHKAAILQRNHRKFLCKIHNKKKFYKGIIG